MKPKDLKSPFSWENRHVHFADRVLYIPDYYDKFKEWSFPGWAEIFQNPKPVAIEFCSGNGSWLAEKAKKNAGFNWVGVEWRFERARQIWSKMKNYALSDLMIVCGEAQVFVREYVPSQSVEMIYINFPDPWPKEKHAKNRIFQAPFIADMWRVLSPGGQMRIVTDDATYACQIKEELLSHGGFSSCFPDPYYVSELADYGDSYFCSLWRSKGKSMHYFHFVKKRGE